MQLQFSLVSCKIGKQMNTLVVGQYISLNLCCRKIKFNSFGAIGDKSGPLIDSCCRLWSTQANVMTSLRLHVKVVSQNHFKVNSVSVESVRTPGGILGGFQSFYVCFLPCIL